MQWRLTGYPVFLMTVNRSKWMGGLNNPKLSESHMAEADFGWFNDDGYSWL